MGQKEKSVKSLTGGIELLFKQNRVDYYKGLGQLISANEIKVTGEQNQTLKAKNIIIATGSEPSGFKGINVI